MKCHLGSGLPESRIVTQNPFCNITEIHNEKGLHSSINFTLSLLYAVWFEVTTNIDMSTARQEHGYREQKKYRWNSFLFQEDVMATMLLLHKRESHH